MASTNIKDPIRIVITGAAGQIAYSLIHQICNGDVFGKDQSVILHLLDIAPMMGVLQGVVMEIEDTSLPLPDVDGSLLMAQDAKAANIVQALKDLKDPYDPATPNDYQEYCKERIRKQIEKERQAELQLQQKERITESTKQQREKAGTPGTFNGVPSMSPIAEKLMIKMGWKGRGHGLGKQEQGITAPLIAQKSGAGAQGIIINADANKQQAQSTTAPTNTSNVIVLRNMVGPGEVDDMLCGETARECMKYGNVLECEVWESPNSNNLPPEEAVRIFVKFEKPEQALQALIDLDGRFFAGRNVRADYYPKDKFARMEFDAPMM